ncbi:MAG: hypothetical protein AAFQ52_18635, partial [Chloroflexota bacterium]
HLQCPILTFHFVLCVTWAFSLSCYARYKFDIIGMVMMSQASKKGQQNEDAKPKNLLKRVLVVAEIVNTALATKQAPKTQE